MSRYSQFEEVESEEDSVLNEEDTNEQGVCIKNLLTKPNPLMSKVQYSPYEARNYYPVVYTKLPPILNNHEYHIDRNNMISIDESVFAHQKMKKDLGRCLASHRMMHREELLTLKQFYAGKSIVYQKYTNHGHDNYFATFVLGMNSVNREKNEKMGKTEFVIRNTRTPLLTERSRTERLSSICRPQIDFNSNFESGNLYKVYQREYNEYDLILQNDINTKGNNQWFFFCVKNVPKGNTVKFNIVNMAKRYSLFDYGMKPAVFSMMKFQRRQIGWVRDGTKINYRENQQVRKEGKQQPYFTLSFEYRFNYDGDIVYFSYSIPYTFTNLCSFLTTKLSDRTNHQNIKVRSIGETLGGNEVNLFEFTNGDCRIQKKSIWILGRQHPGQVTSSFMVEGIINYLLSGCANAEYLMNRYVFRIVPMVNIDGVVHGNSRAELAGCDSNRKWGDPHKIWQPVIYNLRKMIEKDSVQMILDLHSHSRKLGTFFYSNYSPSQSNTIKVFPMMVCRNDERFDYRSNRFKGGSNQTARRAFYEILKIPYIYTIESSFLGYQKESDFKIIPYQPNDYREMGRTVLNTFAELIKMKMTFHPKDERLLLCGKEELEQEGNIWDKMNEVDEVESIGSDENPDEDEFSKKELDAILERKPKKGPKTKRKRLGSKVSQKKKIEESKKEEQELIAKKNDKESYYKKFFSGRCSLNSKMESIFEGLKKEKPEMRNFTCQVDFPEKQVLHKVYLNVQSSRKPSNEKLFEKRELCVVGQKVEDDLVVNGNSVGVQSEMNKVFLKSRNEVVLENRSAKQRPFRSNNKIPTVIMHNQNNFMNRGDILHNALRMMSRR